MRQFDYSSVEQQKWDNEIVGHLSRIHEYRGRQSFYLKTQTDALDRLVDNARLESTGYSNEIEGVRTSQNRLRKLMRENATPRNRDEKEIAGYRDALNVVHETYESIPLSPASITQLRGIMYRYTYSTFGSMFKNAQNYIRATDTMGHFHSLFTPLSSTETADAMQQACDAFNAALEKGTVDPLLLIPIFIRDFLCIHPFIDGNGKMSRLLTALLLFQSGYEVGKYISLETRIAQTRAEYNSALQASQNGWNDNADDPVPFIRYLLRAIEGACQELDERMQIVSSASSLDIVRQAVLSRTDGFSKGDIFALCTNMSASTVDRALRTMLKNGEIIRYGNGKATRYNRNT